MKLIPLSTTNKNNKNYGKYFAMVDDEDFDTLSKFKWTLNTVIIGNCVKLYAKRNELIEGRQRMLKMHRLIMGCTKGDGKMIDHKDGNGLNNTRDNLRFCTPSQNQQNRKTRKSHGYLGIYKRGSNWCSKICINRKQMHLGSFLDKKSAAIAYNDAAKKYHGEFARLNVI